MSLKPSFSPPAAAIRKHGSFWHGSVCFSENRRYLAGPWFPAPPVVAVFVPAEVPESRVGAHRGPYRGAPQGAEARATVRIGERSRAQGRAPQSVSESAVRHAL